MRRTAVTIFLILAVEAGIIAGMVPRGTDVRPARATAGQRTSNSLSKMGTALTVEGTGIEEPVVQATETEGNSYYLQHDRNGAASLAGAVFADYRCVHPSQHVLLYGHSFRYGTEMFTELKHAWQKERFESIGAATLTVNGIATVYRPIAALHVDASYAEIQRFAFSDDEALQVWLAHIAANADIRAEKSADEIARAHHALTLVTCSDQRPRKPGRTVIVFASASSKKIPPLPYRS